MKKKSIRDSLAAATCTLIGLGNPPAIDAAELDTSVLVYTELDRISAFESATHLRRALAEEVFLDVNLTVDILTGASPNGATPSNDVQVFTQASGLGRYVIGPGDTPLDDTFQDNRVALGVGLDVPLGRLSRGGIGGNVSVEYDYISFVANARYVRDFNKRNTSVSVGASLARDALSPEGGPPIPFKPMRAPGERPFRQPDEKDKTVVDVLVGVTQVVDRSTLVQLNYSFSRAAGYLTDPFKMLTTVDGTPGSGQGDPVQYVYENRPESRMKHSVYGLTKHHFSEDVLDASYRYMWDDWGIRSHTAEVRYRLQLDPRRYVQPQLRYYYQSAANFYRHSLIDGDPFPTFASADYRLGEFHAPTFAVKFGYVFLGGREVNLRLGYYLQMGDSSPPDAIGSLRELDLFPTVGAIITQVSYSVSW